MIEFYCIVVLVKLCFTVGLTFTFRNSVTYSWKDNIGAALFDMALFGPLALIVFFRE